MIVGLLVECRGGTLHDTRSRTHRPPASSPAAAEPRPAGWRVTFSGISFDLVRLAGAFVLAALAAEGRPGWPRREGAALGLGEARRRAPAGARGPSDECGGAGGDVFVYLDERGESAFDGRFCGARAFSDGLAAVWRDRKYGFIDKSGTSAIPPLYEVVGDFSAGLAAVKLDGREKRWSFIDKTGRIVIPAVGDGRAEKFERGLAAIDIDSPNGYLATNRVWE